jgi:hypothetical protein
MSGDLHLNDPGGAAPFDRVVAPSQNSADPAAAVTGAVMLALLLDALATFVRRFVVLTAAQVTAVVLYVAQTYVHQSLDVIGYLAITSPERRSGKTRLMDVLELLVAVPWRVIEPSEAVLFRKIDRAQPTLLLDEFDAIFASRRDTEPQRAVLNAGNARGTCVSRCIPPSHDVMDFEVFCPKVLAGIGRLPDTVADRAINIAMKRKLRGEACARFRRRTAKPQADELVAELERWASTAAEPLQMALERVEPLAEDGGALEVLDDRAFEQAWEPLVALASLAGDEWLERAIAAALELSAGRDAQPETVRLRLLQDTRLVFEHLGDRVSSETLAAELANDLDAPWSDWHGKAITPRAIADLLRQFEIRPRSVRFPDGGTAKGYRREQFEDSWRRYVPIQPSQPSQTSPDAHISRAPEPSRDGAVTDWNEAAAPHEQTDVTAVTAIIEQAATSNGVERLREWLARDGFWRSLNDEPPAFPAEVLAYRLREP